MQIKNRARGEFCYLLEGQVDITDETGQVFKFGAGEAFLIPKGFTGTWFMPVAVKKYFAEF
ncbi:MAG: cupin domain-containing protein [Trueperaceae bacterium]